MYLDPTMPSPVRERRAERVGFDLLVRYAWRGLRATVMVKDLTRNGARIEGIEALRKGDGLVLLLPGLAATHATVAWAQGRGAGLMFDEPLDNADYTALLRDFAVVPAAELAGSGPDLRRAA